MTVKYFNRLTHFPVSVALGKGVIVAGFVYMALQTALFVGSFNLFSSTLRIIAVSAFLLYCVIMLWRLLKLNFQDVIAPITINLPIMVLAIGILIFAHIRGPLSFNETLFNFDWGKYHIALYQISQNPFEPQIDFGDSRQHLAYYYAIFLPAAYIGYFFKSLIETDTLISLTSALFDGWLLLGQILVVMAAPLIINALVGKKTPLNHSTIAPLLFVLFAQLDGWEILLRTGELFLGDLEWGPGEKFYLPLRLQSFLSYSFWIPGHFVASLLGLSWLIIFLKNKQLQYAPVLLIYTYTLSSSLFAFISIQLLLSIIPQSYSWQEILMFIKIKWKDISAAMLSCSLILLLYILNSLFKHDVTFYIRHVIITIVMIGVVLYCLSFTQIRIWLQRYWVHLAIIVLIGIFAYVVRNDLKTFAVVSPLKYGVFMIKELGHYIILIILMQYVLYRTLVWPKFLIASFLMIIALSLGASQDFLFSGSIGALLLINLYLGYLFERVWQEKRSWFWIVFIIYMLCISLSLYGLAYETFFNIPYTTDKSFAERILMENWKNVFFDRYTSGYVDAVKF